MMTIYAIWFTVAAVVVLLSYQTIPFFNERIYHYGRTDLAELLHASSVYTAFIRICGFDHLIMAFCMAGMWLGFFYDHMAIALVVCVSETLVALISGFSAFVFWRTSVEARREPWSKT